MEKIRLNLYTRIEQQFKDLNKKTNLRGRYCDDEIFTFEDGVGRHISELEEHYVRNCNSLSDDDLLDLFQFLTEESNLFDFEGFN